jgi:hypothetical protein
MTHWLEQIWALQGAQTLRLRAKWLVGRSGAGGSCAQALITPAADKTDLALRL